MDGEPLYLKWMRVRESVMAQYQKNWISMGPFKADQPRIPTQAVEMVQQDINQATEKSYYIKSLN